MFRHLVERKISRTTTEACRRAARAARRLPQCSPIGSVSLARHPNLQHLHPRWLLGIHVHVARPYPRCFCLRIHVAPAALRGTCHRALPLARPARRGLSLLPRRCLRGMWGVAEARRKPPSAALPPLPCASALPPLPLSRRDSRGQSEA